MRNVLVGVFLIFFLFTFNLSPGEAQTLKTQNEGVILLKIGSNELWMNGEIARTMDVAPFIENNRTWVPLRFVSEAFGAEVLWKQETQQAIVHLGETILTLTIGSNSLLVNGEMKVMDVAPFLRANRTWVPLRFVAENLGCSVLWVQGAQEVVIRRGEFSGPTVGYIQDGRLIMQEIIGGTPGNKKIIAEGHTTGEEISGPICWSFNGLKVAYYRIQKLNFDFFRFALEYSVEVTGEKTKLLSREKAYGGLKTLSWSPGDGYILFDEPTSDVSGTLWLVMVEEQDSAILGEEGEVIYGTFSPDGSHQAWLTYTNEGISVWVLDQEGVILEIPGAIGGFTWSPDGGSLAVSTSRGIEIYDVTAPEFPPEVYAFPGSAYYLFWSPNRNWIAGSCSDGTFALYLGWGQTPWLNALPGDLSLIDTYHPSAPAGFLPSGELVIEHIGEGEEGWSNYYLYDHESEQLTLLLENARFLAVRP